MKTTSPEYQQEKETKALVLNLVLKALRVKIINLEYTSIMLVNDQILNLNQVIKNFYEKEIKTLIDESKKKRVKSSNKELKPSSHHPIKQEKSEECNIF